MSTDKTLPTEILDIIFAHLELAVGNDRQTWCRLSLINRNWYAASILRLYRTFEYHGDYDRRPSLWQFLRTVVLVPELAAHVRTVDLQHCLKWTGPRSFELAKQLRNEHSQIIKQAASQTTLSYLGTEAILEALENDDRRPLVALILACLPNLQTLYMHLSESDPYLDYILSRAVNSNTQCAEDLQPSWPIFQHLECVFLASDGQPSRSGYPLRINKNRPFLYLPRLRELTLISAELEPDFLTNDSLKTISPHLKKLTLAVSESTPLDAVWHLLNSVPPLTSLSMNFHPIDGSRWPPVETLSLWHCLHRFHEALEHVDLSGIAARLPRDEASTTTPFCPPLRKFTRLQTLGIQPTILFGNCLRHSPPIQLLNHLPVHPLAHLTLYSDIERGRGYSTNDLVINFEKQLSGIALRSSPPGRITAERLYRRYIQIPIGGLERACKTRMIPFSVVHQKSLSNGGLYSDFAVSSERHARPFHSGFRDVLGEIQKIST